MSNLPIEELKKIRDAALDAVADSAYAARTTANAAYAADAAWDAWDAFTAANSVTMYLPSSNSSILRAILLNI